MAMEALVATTFISMVHLTEQVFLIIRVMFVHLIINAKKLFPIFCTFFLASDDAVGNDTPD